jgi:preprotein translocase subunit YajC
VLLHLAQLTASTLRGLLHLLVWLQPAVTSGADAGGGAGGGAPAQSCALNALMMVGIGLFTYFFLIRPDQKRREEQEALVKSLQKGMKVRTSGGILGEIVSLTDDEVQLVIAEKVRINVLRENISGPEADRIAKRDAAKSGGKDVKDKDVKAPKDEARS